MTIDRTLELRLEIVRLKQRCEKQRKSILNYQATIEEYLKNVTRNAPAQTPEGEGDHQGSTEGTAS